METASVNRSIRPTEEFGKTAVIALVVGSVLQGAEFQKTGAARDPGWRQWARSVT